MKTTNSERGHVAPATPYSASCVGCKWLYQEGDGWSNYTWEEDYVRCAQDRNANLADGGKEAPMDWNNDTPEEDNWPMTNASRCELYASGPYVTLDVEGEDGPADYTEDAAQIEGICLHCSRGPNGGSYQPNAYSPETHQDNSPP